MMEIVKKNIISIIAGVVALAAIAVAFTMLTSRAEELKTDLAARQQAYSQLEQLLKKDRTLPTISLEKAEAEKLTKFPSQKIIDQGDALIKGVETASKAMVVAAVEMNKHLPLEPGALPDAPAISA